MTQPVSGDDRARGDLEPGTAHDLASTALLLARRFADGATAWCVSPSWPHHARHVAVEFVHPVIVGKPALPAVAVPTQHGSVIGRMRTCVRPGDVIVAIAPRDDRDVRELCRRAPAWGVHTVWIGAGPRPVAGAADRVVWIDDDVDAAQTGAFVLRYHLLWELAHVCLEQLGPLEPSDDRDCEGPVCITCADEGRVAEVLRAGPDADQVVVLSGGRQELADTTLVGRVSPGDLVLLHAGSAISTIDAVGGGVP